MMTTDMIVLLIIHVYLKKRFVTLATSIVRSASSVTISYTTNPYSKLGPHDNVVNPHRGFYWHAETQSSQFSPLRADSSEMHGRSTLLREYFLDDFVNKDLTSTFTDKVKGDLKLARDQGWSVILRFAYADGFGKPVSDLTHVLQNINFLASEQVFFEYKDVITAIQAGFLGAWGEWHSNHDDFGEVGGCTPPRYGLTQTQFDNRKAVLDALLRSAPKSIEICVRRPVFKYMYSDWDGITTLSDDQHMDAKSRLAYHDDAFAHNDDDENTFICEPKDNNYMKDDSVYNNVIAEVNEGSESHIYDCDYAREKMKDYHVTSMGASYYRPITQSWKDNGCYDEFHAFFGYRLKLEKAVLPDVANIGGQLCYRIDIANEGFAAPHKDFETHIVLVNTRDGSKKYSAVVAMDTRSLQPGATFQLTGTLRLPSSFTAGSYEVRLVIFHKDAGGNSKYAVLLANSGHVQDTARRENLLLHTINVSQGSCSESQGTQLKTWPNAVGDRTDNVLPNPSGGCSSGVSMSDGSFEHSAAGWEKFNGGFTLHTTAPQDGSHYIRVTDGGALQVLDFSSSPVTEFYLSGYSRLTTGSSAAQGPDYSIYCDLELTDGNTDYGLHADFPATGHNDVWNFKELHATSSTPIREAWCYAMFRNGHGSADFDNFVFRTCASAGCSASWTDGSFEGSGGWSKFSGGYTVNPGNGAQDGGHYISVTNGAANQHIDFSNSPVTQFTLSGYSRAHSGVSVSNPDDYSIYCDLTFTDDTPSYGHVEPFNASPHSPWIKATLHVNVQQQIKRASCYAMFRNGHGVVDFDNFQLESCS